MTYKAIIFDFFDVLHVDMLHVWLRQHSLPFDGAVRAATVEIDSGRIDLAEFLTKLSHITGLPRASIEADFDNEDPINNELVGLIEKLRQDYKIGLLSNAHSAVIHGIMSRFNLKRLFDLIIISSEVGMLKPSPDIFNHALEKLGVKAGEAIFIDDKLSNVEASRAVGMAGIEYRDFETFLADLNKLGVAVSTLDANR